MRPFSDGRDGFALNIGQFMSQPLAIFFYERLMPGSQLVNRLQDLNYRVLALDNAGRLAATVQREMPLLLLADLAAKGDVLAALKKIKSGDATSHVPIIAFAPDAAAELLAAAQATGTGLVVTESALTNHLPQILEQALNVD
jgi:CheY-like chemotaxis protein